MRFEYEAKGLKEMRQNLGLTQKELAKKMGLKSAQLISNVERGVSSLPIRLILKAFKKDQAVLYSFLILKTGDFAKQTKKELGLDLSQY